MKFFVVLVAKWSRWSPWSECTKTCGNGTRVRSRVCVAQDPTAVFAPISCAGKAQQNKTCSEWNCPGRYCSYQNRCFVRCHHRHSHCYRHRHRHVIATADIKTQFLALG